MNEATLLSEKNSKIVRKLKIINIVFCVLLALGSVIIPLTIGSAMSKTSTSIEQQSSDEDIDLYSDSYSDESSKNDPLALIFTISLMIGGLALSALNYFIFNALIQHYINVAEMNFISQIKNSKILSEISPVDETKSE
ncbi:hypothetical protein [Listeria fleischmannii]|uniref:Uncharacterized protein n=1 Tax=Listeria fleischmannii FSL S10-1203 TaxID=1265822 RepID=W7E2G3_9LIST|nr:hypothetical protein [Listeria fleischmannii]EUJ64818.1 hypothetical protein MCOL2_01425 [Listeria fleischmannii FSL S10-1203]